MPLTTSVVLCTYNGARFLPAQWASVLAQSRLPDEIVVRDDASTDATPTLLEQLAVDARARGVEVTLLRAEQNRGYIANFQAALQAATGHVVFLCDQDDIWHPHKLATQLVEFERRPLLLLLCSDARRIDASGADLGRSLFQTLRVRPREWQSIHAGHGFDVLLRRSMATGATVALRRTLLADALPFPPGWVHDEWLAIIAAARGGFDGQAFALLDYRQHAANQIGMRWRSMRTRVREFRAPPSIGIDRLIARDEQLYGRLLAMPDRVPETTMARVRDKLAHLHARAATAGAAWSRLAPVLRESLRGRYRRFGPGWRLALRDVLHRP